MATMATLPPFQYPPLSIVSTNIRVIQIAPGSDFDPIQCSMTITQPELAQHTALSYVWGTDLPSHEIVINAQSFYVAKNLYAFLRLCQQQHSNRLMWIDAICINQSNIPERNHQVRQMLKTYQSASEVFVWLGHYDSSIVAFLKAARACSLTSLNSCVASLSKDEAQEVLHTLTTALLPFSVLEYWSRLWIVPEFLVPQNIQLLYGSERLAGSDLATLIKEMESPVTTLTYNEKQLSEYTWTPAGARFWMLMNARGAGSIEFTTTPHTFGYLLRSSGDGLCSDKRDRVFALLALSDSPDAYVVDYSMSADELFWQVLTHRRNDIDDINAASKVRSGLIQRCHSVREKLGLDYTILQRVEGISVELWSYVEGRKKQRGSPDTTIEKIVKGIVRNLQRSCLSRLVKYEEEPVEWEGFCQWPVANYHSPARIRGSDSQRRIYWVEIDVYTEAMVPSRIAAPRPAALLADPSAIVAGAIGITEICSDLDADLHECLIYARVHNSRVPGQGVVYPRGLALVRANSRLFPDKVTR